MAFRVAETTVRYDADMDPECIWLCDVLNALPGIRTFESCCGHGAHPFRISLVVTNDQPEETIEAIRKMVTVMQAPNLN